MQITEVRIKLMEGSDDRLQAFCSITFDDCFVIRDLKIIDGANGAFVAMPSRKLTSHCPHCRCKNHLRAAHCNQCGARLKEDRALKDTEGRAKLYADIAHPVNSACREMIQERVIAEYRGELERAKQPGYVSRYDDDLYHDAGEDHPLAAPRSSGPPAPHMVVPAANSTATTSSGPANPTPSPTPTVSPAPAPTEASAAIDKPQFQPPETGVRAPHAPPSRTAGENAPPPPQRRQDGFGQGIL